MPRKLIIFGNGIGMATDPVHFSLTNALADIWNHPTILSAVHKELICRCTGSTTGSAPTGEHELDILHQAVAACSRLNGIGGGNIHWLSEDGAQFPFAISRFLHKVAIRLHNYQGQINQEFFNSLAQFVHRTNSHIATLNYDRLIYSHFIDCGLLAGYNGTLIDGIVNEGFHEDRLQRRYGRNFGYYLHLHGSPLFLEHLGTIYKLQRHQLELDMEKYGEHIVLTHVTHKASVINDSYLLSTYWKYLSMCLPEAEEVILFGYSGEDLHLNTLLSSHAQSKPFRIIEWEGAGVDYTRPWYWSQKLGINNPNIVRLDNITNFRDW
jgi:hypothetical protein